jgi:ABC-2 type transport system ATP-binding protein
MKLAAITTENLTKYYAKGNVRALEDLTLEVEPGIIFSLLGPNGAGKTTLLKLLLGICHPTRGNAKLFDQDIRDYHSHAKLGYLAENHRFPEFLNARQVLYYYGKMGGISSNILEERIPQLLKLVKLDNWEKTKTRKYSKGMLQRLGIAQTLVNDPELLFLDEPTDGIDPVGRREIRDLLISLRDRGKTIFLNSHLLSEVERVSDQIAILKEGRLKQKGTVQEFISMKDQFQILLSDGKESIESECARLNISLTSQNGAYFVSVNDDQHLNQLIDALRNRKVTIQAVIPHKITLEDFFIKVIEEKEGKQS